MTSQAKLDVGLEHADFVNRVRDTGIGQHLSGVALMLCFLMLGRKMWRNVS